MNVLGAYYGIDPAEVILQFKGLKSHQKKSKVIYCDLERNESFKHLQNLTHTIIQKFLDKKIVREHELQHTTFVDGQWTPDFHLTVMRSSSKTIPDSKKLI